MTINQKVELLRQWMREQPEQPNVYIIPTADPHGSEYIAPHWACREWITGFTGSAGTAVVTLNEALLWTDSRYWLQAEQQLANTPFQLMKEGTDPSVGQWLSQQFPQLSARVGVPAQLLDAATISHLHGYNPQLATQPNGTTLVTRTDAFATIWEQRPALPQASIEVQDEATAGETAQSKLTRLQQALITTPEAQPHDVFLFNNLEDIAWLLNLRGHDIDYNPVFIAFLTYHRSTQRFTLFTHYDTLTPTARQHLESLNIQLRSYHDELLTQTLQHPHTRFTTEGPVGCIPTVRYNTFANPIPLWRAIKNEAECEGFRQAMRYDGVAMVKLLRWLDEQMQQGQPLTELSVVQQLHTYRAACPHFKGDSFPTIAAYNEHGAIVHYEPDAQSNIALQPHGLLLLDSGGQYACGTTDITRTIACGTLTHEERRINTLVMKGHLRLAAMRFPVGTTGLQLDLAARMDMWAAGYDFGHGTGHGVGAYLCVHEGPQQIRKDDRPCTHIPFTPGMTITDEPGIYVTGKFGVRIENTLLCIPHRTTPFGHFLAFEVLTLCPYDIRALDLSLLTTAEVDQINAYHHQVRTQLMPLLTDDADKLWLAHATAAIECGEAE